jgi:hypothetical protein
VKQIAFLWLVRLTRICGERTLGTEMAAMKSPMVVVETETFLASAARLGMSARERAALIIYLAGNPQAGALVAGTGGARVIYYYHNQSIPLYTLDIYAKNRKQTYPPPRRRRRAKRSPRS